MLENQSEHELRIKTLEQEIEVLKNVLGSFALGLDKVSQIQENQTSVIEGLVQANEAQVYYLKSLIENTEQNNELLRRLLENNED